MILQEILNNHLLIERHHKYHVGPHYSKPNNADNCL